MPRRRPSLPTCLCGAVASVLVALPVVAQGPTAAGGPARRAAVVEPCEATVVRRETLKDSAGGLLYIAPDAVVARDGELLLAGHNSLRFARGANGEYDIPTPSSFVLVRRDRQGRVHTVAAPAELAQSELRDLRVTALPNGRWGVLFFEVRDTSRIFSPLNRLVFAELGPKGWTSVATLSPPAGYEFGLPVPRAVLHHNGRITVAAVLRHIEEGGDRSGVMLFTRERGTWSSRIVSEQYVSHADLALDERKGLLSLLTIRADVGPGITSVNEVFVRTLPHPPLRSHRVPFAPVIPAFEPVLHRLPTGLSAAWITREERGNNVRSIAWHSFVTSSRRDSARRVADDVERFVTVRLSDERVVGVTSTQSTPDTVEVQLHTLPESSRGIRLLHPSIHARIMGAGRWSDSELVVTLANMTTTRTPSIATEVYWLTAHCSTDSAEGRRVP